MQLSDNTQLRLIQFLSNIKLNLERKNIQGTITDEELLHLYEARSITDSISRQLMDSHETKVL